MVIDSLADCQRAGSTTAIVNCLSDPDLLADPNSPQSQALQWILDSREVDNWDGLELSQRYVIGVLMASSTSGLQSFGNQNNLICDTPAIISCNLENEITDLDFSSSNPASGGTLPPEIGALTAIRSLVGKGLDAPVPSEIGLLTQLTLIEFQYNAFRDIPIPSEIGLLTQLNSLVLDNNDFIRTFPSELGQLTALETLLIAEFNFGIDPEGPFPIDLFQLTALKSLDLQGNLFTGTLPTQIGQLTALESFLIYDNYEVSGAIPSELGQLTSLTSLTIDGNEFSGTIPTEIFQLTALREFLLWSEDSLTGPIPTEIGFLTALSLMNVWGNDLLTGPIPTTIGQLTSLVGLAIWRNPLVAGTIPSEIGQLTALTGLYLRGNQLSGTIPATMTQLVNLEQVEISENNLTGAVPAGFCAAPFPDWRNGGGYLEADCTVTCSCCAVCFDAFGNPNCWDEFTNTYVVC